VLVHARGRIGSEPWLNFDEDQVASDVADLHANGMELAARGPVRPRRVAATAGSGRIYCFAVAERPLFRDGFEAGP
jgi:hypothetical protein